MRALRSAVCLAAVVTVAGGGLSAHAATKPKPKAKPVCNLVTDASGDGEGLAAESSGLDILSADIASSATTLTAVLRLSGAPVKPGSTAAPEGANYYVTFSAPGSANPLYLQTSVGLTGTTYSFGDVEPQGGEKIYTDKTGVVTGSIVGSVLTMKVSTSVFSALASVSPGIKLTDLGADVFYPLEVPEVGGLLETADTASSTKTYVTGTPSCVKP